LFGSFHGKNSFEKEEKKRKGDIRSNARYCITTLMSRTISLYDVMSKSQNNLKEMDGVIE